MKNILFYMATVFIWGTTWIAIKMQLGAVDPMVSVSYRFALAAIILLAWCRFRHLSMQFSLADHLFMALQGIFLFALNYQLFYLAELHIASGLAAVIFSTIMLMNTINGAILLRTPIEPRVIAGGLIGFIGIGMVFWTEISAFSIEHQGLRGVLLCTGATYLASLGNILSARNQKQGLPVVQTNAFGMTYGAVLMLMLSVITGKSFQIDPTAIYLGSLGYLAVFGSIIAFGCYLTLIGEIGANRAAYTTLLFPLVALTVSTIWEDFHWTPSAIFGVVLILSGNALMLQHHQQQTPNAEKTQIGQCPDPGSHLRCDSHLSLKTSPSKPPHYT